MAIKIPDKFQLDSANFPKEKWAEELIGSLNKWVLQVQTAFASIPVLKFKDVTFNTGPDPTQAFPIVIEVGARPAAVWVGSVVGATLWSAEPVTVLWVMNNSGQVQINNISGLVPNAKDTIRLVWI